MKRPILDHPTEGFVQSTRDKNLCLSAAGRWMKLRELAVKRRKEGKKLIPSSPRVNIWL